MISEVDFFFSISEFLICDISTDVQLLFIQEPSRQTDIADKDNDHSDQEMDADDLCYFEDRFPDVLPRSTINFGPYARFLANMPDWNNMSQDDFNKACAALPLPLAGPSPPCCSSH